ncbi:uncharacterized protein [Amphiura filiformis]|uniref:uncharacterized protein n=1 Tax=Amphiura filiformis TaxID=82378 RepID=UPI003B21F604
MYAYCTAAVTYNGKLKQTPLGLKKQQQYLKNDFELQQQENRRKDSKVEQSSPGLGSNNGRRSYTQGGNNSGVEENDISLPKVGFIYRLGNTKFEVGTSEPRELKDNATSEFEQTSKSTRASSKWKNSTTSEFEQTTKSTRASSEWKNSTTSGFEQTSKSARASSELEDNTTSGFEQSAINAKNKRHHNQITFSGENSHATYDLKEVTSDGDSVANLETADSSSDEEDNIHVLTLEESRIKTPKNDTNFLLKESSTKSENINTNFTHRGTSTITEIDTGSPQTRFIYRLGKTQFESHQSKMDGVVTSYVGARKFVASEAVARSRHGASSERPANSPDGVTNPAYDTSLDDDTGETKRAVANDEASLHSSPIESKIDLDKLSSEGSTPATIIPQKTTTMTFRLQQPFPSTQQYSSVSHTVTTISSTSSTVTVSHTPSAFAPPPSSVTSSSADTVYASPTPVSLAEISNTPTDSPAVKSSATSDNAPMTEPSSGISTLSTNKSYSFTFPRPYSSPPAPPEPSHPAPPSPRAGTTSISPAPSSVTSPSEPSHPAPSSPPTSTAYSSSSLPSGYGTTLPHNAAPVPETPTQQQKLKRLRRTNTAPPWLPSLPSQPSEPTPPPTPPPSPPPPTPPHSSPPSPTPGEPSSSPSLDEPSHSSPAPSTLQSSDKPTLLNLSTTCTPSEPPPDLHIPPSQYTSSSTFSFSW